MAEIEFLVAGATDASLADQLLAESDQPSSREVWRKHLPTTIAAALWTAAATLCTLAPFRALFRDRAPGADGGGVDGWGRYFHTGAFQGDPAGFHGTRYGIVLVACALVFALLALVIAGVAWSQPRWSRAGRGAAALRKGVPGVAFAVFGVTAGTGVAALLDAVANRDSFTAAIGSVGATDELIAPLRPTFVIGPVAWLTLGAAACALLAALASCVTPPDEPPPEPAYEPPPIWTPPHEDDELLGG